jgi:hypothetical protein
LVAAERPPYFHALRLSLGAPGDGPPHIRQRPLFRRVGIRIITFEACSGFTRVTLGGGAGMGVDKTATLPGGRAPRIQWYSLFDLPREWRASTRHRGAEGCSYYRHR